MAKKYENSTTKSSETGAVGTAAGDTIATVQQNTLKSEIRNINMEKRTISTADELKGLKKQMMTAKREKMVSQDISAL